MTYVIVGTCINDTACVKVCPVAAIHPTPREPGFAIADMLYIDPESCIDCNACVPECPAEAIQSDIEPGLEHWLELNARFAKEWPEVTVKRDAPADADDHKGEAGKFEKYFSPEPGEGD